LLLHSWPPVSFSLTDLIPFSKFLLAITIYKFFYILLYTEEILALREKYLLKWREFFKQQQEIKSLFNQNKWYTKKNIYGLTMNKTRFYGPASCLEVWLRLLFKMLFMPKCIEMIFFLFFKNYFWNQHIKTIQNIKKIKF